MTFDELNSLVVAVRAHKVNYNYFTGVVEMTITPEYGVKDEAKGKTFLLKFEGCIYFFSTKISKAALTGYAEFISWGRLVEKGIVEKAITESQLNGIGGVPQEIPFKEYSNYFFENTQGDRLKIICKKVIVSEQIKDR